MKESTFGLIKNISDTNFWKSGLKLSFANSQSNDIQYDDSGRHEDEDDVQSFPCFYECVHKKCRLSDLDTKYVNYSIPDVQNTKLKCCRAFLRIAMLSETSCYGLEVSDINHCKCYTQF